MIRFLGTNAKIININNLKNKNDIFDMEKIKKLIETVKRRANYEICDDRYYAPINESLVNNYNRNNKGVSFIISQDSDNYSGHMLEVAVIHPQNGMPFRRPLAYGDKKQILEFLDNKESLKTIKNDLNAIQDDIKNS